MCNVPLNNNISTFIIDEWPDHQLESRANNFKVLEYCTLVHTIPYKGNHLAKWSWTLTHSQIMMV